MYREEVLDNYYMIKEAASGLVAAGIGGLSGQAGRRSGKEIARERYKNLSAEDIEDIDERTQGGGTGALRGFGYALGGALGGAALTGGRSLGAMHAGALGLGAYGGLSSRRKAKSEFLRRAQAKSDRKRVERMRRD